MKCVSAISPRFPGVLSILKSKNDTIQGQGLSATTVETQHPFPPFFSNSQRRIVSQICGWGFDSNASLEESVSRYLE